MIKKRTLEMGNIVTTDDRCRMVARIGTLLGVTDRHEPADDLKRSGVSKTEANDTNSKEKGAL